MSFENPFEEKAADESEKILPIEHNEIELNEDGELIVNNQRSEQSTVNQSEISAETSELEERFLEAKKFIDSLKPDQRAFVEQEVERNLRGVMPADYEEEYKKEFIDQAAKLNSLKK